MSFLEKKMKKLYSYWFQVPWCVPIWGWREFRTTVTSLVTASARQGPKPDRFAGAVKKLLGRQFAIPVDRGREAVCLALRALNVQASDEVVLPSYICTSVLDAVLHTGATPVFADVDESLHVTTRSVEAVLTANTRCVIVPHIFGNTAPVDEIEAMLQAHGIALIDDAAQGFGALRGGRQVGSFGEFGVVCGGPGKPLTGPAGGLLLMNDPELYQNATRNELSCQSSPLIVRRMLEFWFWRRFRRYTVLLGTIVDRLSGRRAEPTCEPHGASNLDAAVLCDQLDQLFENRQKREEVARELVRMLEPLGWRIISDFGPEAIPLKLVLLLPDAAPNMKTVLEGFAAAGIECQGGYAPCHRKVQAVATIRLQNTEAMWQRVLCIPIESPLKNRDKLRNLVQVWSKIRANEHQCSRTAQIAGHRIAGV
jgi:dTDP-4-amino-4,6-dideoxygalactose transaminase